MNYSVSLSSGAIDRWRLCGKDMTIIICKINSKTGNGAGSAVGVIWVDRWHHARKRCPENFRILGNKRVELRLLKCAVRFFGSDQIRSVWVSTGRNELKSLTLQHALCLFGVSIVWLALTFMHCVSLLVSPIAEGRNKQTCSYQKWQIPLVLLLLLLL